MKSMEQVLKSLIGKKVDITIVHNLEGVTRITTGKLIEVSESFIKLEVEYKDHFWSLRKKTDLYYCNRKASSLLSCVEIDVQDPIKSRPFI